MGCSESTPGVNPQFKRKLEINADLINSKYVWMDIYDKRRKKSMDKRFEMTKDEAEHSQYFVMQNYTFNGELAEDDPSMTLEVKQDNGDVMFKITFMMGRI